MAIQGKIKQSLTMDSVLNKVSELDIFYFYIPVKGWKLNETMCSPLREDKFPSFLVGNKYGTINFKDFALDTHKGDCFKFVQLMYNLPNLDATLRKIDFDMGLGISGEETKEYERVRLDSNKAEISKRNSLIQMITRKFTKGELDYWSSYYQGLEDLRGANIYSIKKMYLNKQLFPIGDDELRFGYFYPTGGHWKAYFPLREKKKKWVGNVPLITTYGSNRLESGKNTLICKSLKDFLVCIKIYPHCIQIQNESLSAFSEETVEYIKNHTNITFYGGDSDNPGKQASYAITGAFGYKHINPLERLLPNVKDFSDWAKMEDLNALKAHFIRKNLI
jgi:hypothetical protein